MAGGSSTNVPTDVAARAAAMEPRPDGRGKAAGYTSYATQRAAPQWSPGLMAGGRGR